MSTERRLDALEEISRLLIAASRGMNDSIQRMEAMERQRAAMLQELSESMELLSASMEKLSASVRRLDAMAQEREQLLRELSESIQITNEAIQALMGFVPITQAEIIRLDHRLDRLEGR